MDYTSQVAAANLAYNSTFFLNQISQNMPMHVKLWVLYYALHTLTVDNAMLFTIIHTIIILLLYVLCHVHFILLTLLYTLTEQLCGRHIIMSH